VVAFDATLINPEYRGKLLLQFPKIPILYFAFVKTDYQVIKERNEKRIWKQIEINALKKMYEDYKFPSKSEKTYYYRVFDVTNENFLDTIEIGARFILNLYGS